MNDQQKNKMLFRLTADLSELASNHSENDGSQVVTTNRKLAQDRALKKIVGHQPKTHRPWVSQKVNDIVGWGRKASGHRAVALAKTLERDFCLLEDGFLRSMGREDETLALVFDKTGIFYDATGPSDLEELISRPLSAEQIKRAQRLISLWRDNRVSKYNALPDYADDLPENYVLVVDQVGGDLSIAYGHASPRSFHQMLDAALREHPDKTIIVKLHPDVYTRSAVSHFHPDTLKKTDRVRVIAQNCHPVRLIEQADAVYTVTSQIGFEALLWGKKVRCFGMPFYAGWGLTGDFLPAPHRRGNTTLEQLAYAALVLYPRYVDPITDQLTEAECLIEHIGLQRSKLFEFSPDIKAIGFSRWKKPIIKAFFKGSSIEFLKPSKLKNLRSTETIAVWGSKYRNELATKERVLRIEDGFLRSCGLGADLIKPVSLVIDDVGIYFDATRPSKLENIYNDISLNSDQKARAKKLLSKIVDSRLTKYNVGTSHWQCPKTHRKVLLVVGQVESDASIEFGSPRVKSNLDLVRSARILNPEAYIIYKPHPDVLANLRRRGHHEEQVSAYCDEIIGNIETSDLFSQIDELHTMTSLMGFEALMRGVHVVCHGLPFYAGWGLTEDLMAIHRRDRRLTLEELVYGALIAYPRYMLPKTSTFISPEQAIDYLVDARKTGISTRRFDRKIIRLFTKAWSFARKQDRP